MSFDNGVHDIHDTVIVRNTLITESGSEDKFIETTIGRLIFNEIIPDELGYYNVHFDKKKIMGLIEHCYETCGTNMTGKLLDDVKDMALNSYYLRSHNFS